MGSEVQKTLPVEMVSSYRAVTPVECTTLQLKEHILCRPRARSPNIDGGDVRVIRASVLVGTVVEGLPLGPVGVSEENNKQQNEGLFHENLGFGVVHFNSVSNVK